MECVPFTKVLLRGPRDESGNMFYEVGDLEDAVCLGSDLFAE
jgi:hypothetical protein